MSSESTDASRHGAPRPRGGSINLYSPTFALSSQVERGTLEATPSTRAVSNQYTRPSRSEMAETNAAYQYSQGEDDASEIMEDYAIWVLVRSLLHTLASTVAYMV
jgi:hypothetical protein